MAAPRSLSLLGLLWLAIAVTTAVPAMALGYVVVFLYSAGWMHGFEPALALETLLVVQMALAVAFGVRMSRGKNDVVATAITGMALGLLYAPVTTPVTPVRGEWIVIAPLAVLSLGVAVTAAFALARWRWKGRADPTPP